MALVTFANGNVLEAQELNDSFAAVDWNENVIMNGAIQVAQRGTSSTGITGVGYFTADRWSTGISTLGTWTQTVENDAPTGSGFRKSLKMLCTTTDATPAAADEVKIQQAMEGQNVQIFAKGTANAKTFNLSFWVKSNLTGTYIAELLDADNTRQVSAAYTISVAGTWEYKTITFPADTLGVLDNDNEVSLRLNFALGAGSNFTSGTLNTSWATTTNANRYVGQVNVAATLNNYWQVTGVQLQPSRTSQYLFQDYGTVLDQCQRYYQRFNNTTGKIYGSAMAYSTTAIYAFIKLTTTMRVAPSAIETTATAADYAVTLNNTGNQALTSLPSFNNSTIDMVQLLGTSTTGNLVQGNASYLTSNNNNSYIAFSADL